VHGVLGMVVHKRLDYWLSRWKTALSASCATAQQEEDEKNRNGNTQCP